MKLSSLASFVFNVIIFAGLFRIVAAQSQEPDIGQKTQVTTDRTLETTPAWSKDGQNLFFVSDRFGGLGIFRVSRGGGGGVAVITQPAAGEVDIYPDVNPIDGQIAFASNRSRGLLQIWTVHPGARGLTQLTNAPYGATFPAWSPNGKEIAFSAPEKNGQMFVWIMNVDGSDQRQLTPGTQPRWSADGKNLVYSSITKGPKANYDIYMIEIETGTISQITTEDTNEYQPDWSSDGKWIVYVAFKGALKFQNTKSGTLVIADLNANPQYEIWIKRIDDLGKGSTQITRSKGFDGWPRWSPVHHELAFISKRSGSLDLWTMIPGDK